MARCFRPGNCLGSRFAARIWRATSISVCALASRPALELAFGNCLSATYSPNSFTASQTTAIPPLPRSFSFEKPLGQRSPYCALSASSMPHPLLADGSIGCVCAWEGLEPNRLFRCLLCSRLGLFTAAVFGCSTAVAGFGRLTVFCICGVLLCVGNCLKFSVLYLTD